MATKNGMWGGQRTAVVGTGRLVVRVEDDGVWMRIPGDTQWSRAPWERIWSGRHPTTLTPPWVTRAAENKARRARRAAERARRDAEHAAYVAATERAEAEDAYAGMRGLEDES